MDARLGMDVAQYAPRNLAMIEPDRLVRNHMALVRRIGWHVSSRYRQGAELDDLIQVGMVALVEAARRFEDRGHAAFATYATVRVRGAMVDSMRKRALLSRDGQRHRREIDSARQRLAGQLGRAASDDKVAEQLGVTVETLNRNEFSSRPQMQVSLDDAYNDETGAFASSDPDQLDLLIDAKRRERMTAALASLPRREALVLQLYFVDQLNLAEIAQVLNVGAPRVCQIKSAALARMRTLMEAWA
jgi:RNA polymerase sigma factor FliA